MRSIDLLSALNAFDLKTKGEAYQVRVYLTGSIIVGSVYSFENPHKVLMMNVAHRVKDTLAVLDVDAIQAVHLLDPL